MGRVCREVAIGYAGEKLRRTLAKLGQWTLDIVKRSETAKGVEPLPRRWVVERSSPGSTATAGLPENFEATIESAAAWLFIASVKLLTRRIARRLATAAEL